MQNEKPKDTDPNESGTDLGAVGAKALDIALGMASLTVEAGEFATRYIVEKSPEWVANLEERGRPVREQLSGAVKTYRQPLPVETGDSEIADLERRIRELESQVDSTPAPVTGTVTNAAPSEEPAPFRPTRAEMLSPLPFVAPDMDEPVADPTESSAPGIETRRDNTESGETGVAEAE